MSIFKVKLLSFFLIVLQYSGNLVAQENSLLWRISSPNLAHESYLFGTIHIICEDDFLMDTRIKEAFDSSDKLIMELNMADPNMMSEMQQASMNPNFTNLKNEFSEKDAARVDEFLKENYGAGLEQFGILKPFVLSSMILLRMLPCESQKGYELFFTEQAKANNIPIVGLETVSYQVGIFDSIPKKLQLDEIVKMVDSDGSLEEFNQMAAAYLSEDLTILYTLITENEMFQKYGDLLLTNRNRNWIPTLEEHLKEQTVFIAVGAGHLVSEKGIINLLRGLGYIVEPIKAGETLGN